MMVAEIRIAGGSLSDFDERFGIEMVSRAVINHGQRGYIKQGAILDCIGFLLGSFHRLSVKPRGHSLERTTIPLGLVDIP
jgi:hypothetical protein